MKEERPKQKTKASSNRALPLPSKIRMGEIVRGFENNPETLGMPDREDWTHLMDELNSS